MYKQLIRSSLRPLLPVHTRPIPSIFSCSRVNNPSPSRNPSPQFHRTMSSFASALDELKHLTTVVADTGEVAAIAAFSPQGKN